MSNFSDPKHGYVGFDLNGDGVVDAYEAAISYEMLFGGEKDIDEIDDYDDIEDDSDYSFNDDEDDLIVHHDITVKRIVWH